MKWWNGETNLYLLGFPMLLHSWVTKYIRRLKTKVLGVRYVHMSTVITQGITSRIFFIHCGNSWSTGRPPPQGINQTTKVEIIAITWGLIPWSVSSHHCIKVLLNQNNKNWQINLHISEEHCMLKQKTEVRDHHILYIFISENIKAPNN